MKKIWILLVIVFCVIMSCKHKKLEDPTKADHKEISSADVPHLQNEDWVKNAVIYEVNTRQFSTEGTFAKVEEALPRIKELGVDIVWFMPIHEIGLKNRKLVEGKTAEENLGSYYSVKDYRSVNPEFGTKEDFKRLVDKAHGMGMKVIIDWVPNHTAWDHAWVTEHPEYYTKDKEGNITDPMNPETGEKWGWTDVADLDYSNQELWNAMHADMAYWVSDFDIDGFRCDVAGEVPSEFWAFNNPKLNEIKPLFMLAEAHQVTLFEYFNMLYAWDFMGLMNDVNDGKKPVQEFLTYMQNHNKEDLYMYFTANHDENTWNDAPMKYGENYKNFAILTYMVGGMPLIYNGQEANISHKLEFFIKDEINWTDQKNQAFFTGLTSFYKENTALWNGLHYGEFKAIESPEGTLAFSVSKEENVVAIFQNYTETVQEINLSNIVEDGKVYSSLLDGQNTDISGKMLKVQPHSTIVLDLK